MSIGVRCPMICAVEGRCAAANNAAAVIFETTSIFSGTASSFLQNSFQPINAIRLIKNSRIITSSMTPPYRIDAIHVGVSKLLEFS